MASDKRIITVRIIDRLNEPFEYKNVRTYNFPSVGALFFVSEDGVEHITNAEFHIKEAAVKE